MRRQSMMPSYQKRFPLLQQPQRTSYNTEVDWDLLLSYPKHANWDLLWPYAEYANWNLLLPYGKYTLVWPPYGQVHLFENFRPCDVIEE